MFIFYDKVRWQTHDSFGVDIKLIDQKLDISHTANDMISITTPGRKVVVCSLIFP